MSFVAFFRSTVPGTVNPKVTVRNLENFAVSSSVNLRVYDERNRLIHDITTLSRSIQANGQLTYDLSFKPIYW
ncbi:MAG: hypothetical protein RMH75_02615 [Archaeoglobaceae archaeon]|nr:hypothetical protein [Archaeoglobaceae archaeon]